MKVLYVAEIGTLHKGDPGLAYECIRQAKLAGATATKFQLGWDRFGPPPAVQRAAPMGWIPDLLRWGNDLGIGVFASIMTLEALEKAEASGMGMYKLAHQKAGEVQLLAALIETGKPVFASSAGAIYPIGKPNLHSIYVQSTYPTFKPQVPESFGDDGWFGYSSHAHGIGDALLAVARGARYVEKHLCLDRELVTRDAGFALLPAEFRAMVDAGREIERVL